MMKSKVWALVAAAALLGACGDDDPSEPDDPDLTRADVEGQYVISELSFDPQGSGLGLADLLDRIDFAVSPEMILSATDDSVQLIFRIEGDLLRVIEGEYDLGDTDVTVELDNALEPGEILIPRVTTYFFNEETETLTFNGTFQADTTRLFELVPEWSGEPVANPLPGALRITFERVGGDDD